MIKIFKNNKAQLAVLGVIFALLIFVVLWAMFFSEQITYWSQQTIEMNNLTGAEAFFMAYMNLWILIGVILGTLATMYFGGQG